MRLFTLVAIIFTIILPLSVHGGDTQSITGEISALKVLEALYGKLTIKNGRSCEPAIWHNINLPADLEKYFSYDKYGEVYVAFEARYKENGIDKYVLVTQTRPDNDHWYECHACAPLIGCVVFAKSGNGWVMQSQNKYIGVIGKFGWINKETIGGPRDKVELLKVGAEKYGVLIRGDDVHQGYENYYIYLIVPYKDVLKVSLADGIEGAGSGACLDLAAENRQGIYFAFDKNDAFEYYDLTVTKQWNKEHCGEVKSVKETRIYTFADGMYAEKRAAKQ
jgi:hypothetical protein